MSPVNNKKHQDSNHAQSDDYEICKEVVEHMHDDWPSEIIKAQPENCREKSPDRNKQSSRNPKVWQVNHREQHPHTERLLAAIHLC